MQPFDLVIRGGTVATATDSFKADVGIRGDKVAAIGDGLDKGKSEIDARGKYVLPGGVDAHGHIEQLSASGKMNADTFESATTAAAHGGTTTVISFAAQHVGMSLKTVVDEYHEAASLDPRRLPDLRERILDRTESLGIDRDLDLDRADPVESRLARLDGHICEVKELQIRDGLHVLGRSPDGERLTDLLVALARSPRGRGEGADASLLRALAADLGLDWDPLGAGLGDPWAGPRPESAG